MKIKPVAGFVLIETKEVGGSEFVTSTGEKIGVTKENYVAAVSKKEEKDLEWKVGDKVALGEGAKGFEMEEGKKKYALISNSFIIAVL